MSQDSQELQYPLPKGIEHLKDLNIMITGGTGSFGHKMVETLLTYFKPKRLIIFSRDEFKQSEMKKRFNPKTHRNLRYFIGDVRDYDRLEMALNGVDLVFHASALKRIQECEYEPLEAIKTNILGTNNVIRASIRNGVGHVIGLSTDKACSPVNLYGCTKLAAEKLLIHGNLLSGGKTKFAVCRYGNIFGSRGSLFHIFSKQLEENRPLTVTDLTMTRFNMLQEDAVHFVLLCFKLMTGGEIFIPKLPSYDIEQVVRCFGVEEGGYQLIGTRPGEKYHELMISADESHLVYEFSDFFIMAPLEEHSLLSFQIDEYDKKGLKNCGKLAPGKPYSSQGAKRMSDDRLRLLISKFQ